MSVGDKLARIKAKTRSPIFKAFFSLTINQIATPVIAIM